MGQCNNLLTNATSSRNVSFRDDDHDVLASVGRSA